jgi:hypothetical protein
MGSTITFGLTLPEVGSDEAVMLYLEPIRQYANAVTNEVLRARIALHETVHRFGYVHPATPEGIAAEEWIMKSDNNFLPDSAKNILHGSHIKLIQERDYPH